MVRGRDTANFSLVTMGHPTLAPKITLSHGLIHKPNYLPHLWTHLTYHLKMHSYLISCFATMHWTDRQTHTLTDGWGNV